MSYHAPSKLGFGAHLKNQPRARLDLSATPSLPWPVAGGAGGVAAACGRAPPARAAGGAGGGAAVAMAVAAVAAPGGGWGASPPPDATRPRCHLPKMPREHGAPVAALNTTTAIPTHS